MVREEVLAEIKEIVRSDNFIAVYNIKVLRVFQIAHTALDQLVVGDGENKRSDGVPCVEIFELPYQIDT